MNRKRLHSKSNATIRTYMYMYNILVCKIHQSIIILFSEQFTSVNPLCYNIILHVIIGILHHTCIYIYKVLPIWKEWLARKCSRSTIAALLKENCYLFGALPSNRAKFFVCSPTHAVNLNGYNFFDAIPCVVTASGKSSTGSLHDVRMYTWPIQTCLTHLCDLLTCNKIFCTHVHVCTIYAAMYHKLHFMWLSALNMFTYFTCFFYTNAVTFI